MATQQILLSPAELAYLHSSLSLRPPIRPDGRTPTQFRPLTAETGVLPGTNGSARVHLADGTEAIVGVKAELEKTVDPLSTEEQDQPRRGDDAERTRGEWLELAVEIPGQRDDEASTVFLAEMLREALLADKEFARKLWINRRFHWRLYLDVRFLFCPVSDGCAKLITDPSDITAFILPAPPPLSHHTSRTPCHEATQVKIRRR